MSLICWLPLNQDLHNQGISNLVKANVSAATVLENNGKIGKCYTNTGTTASAATPLILNTIAFSACAWVRINTSRTNWCRAFGMGGTNTYFGLGCEHSNGTLLGFHFYKTIDGTNTSIFDNYPTSKQVGTWVHYAMTYDGEKAYLYENGNLLNTLTIATARQNTRCEMTNLYLFGGTSGNYSQCSLNDVRVYDHCLSTAEVKEIAQGLILHYKLDDGYIESTTNYAPSPYSTTYNNATYAWDTTKHPNAIIPAGWSSGYNGGVSNPSTGYHAMWNLIDNIPTVVFQNHNSEISATNRWLGVSSNTLSILIPPTVKYTISYEQKTLDTLGGYTTCGIYYKYNSSSNTTFHDGCPKIGQNTKLNVWEKFSYTFTRNSNVDSTATNGTIYIYGSYGTESTMLVRNIQLELNDHATPYVISNRLSNNINIVSNNLITGLTAGGQTTISNGNTVTTSGTNADTYFRLTLSTPMIQNHLYKLSCNVSGLASDGYWSFPIAGQSNTTIPVFVLKNGYNEIIFRANNACVNAGTSVMMDDNGSTSRTVVMTANNFKLYDVTPIIYDSSGFNNNGTIVGEFDMNITSPRYDKSLYLHSIDPTTNSEKGISYIQTPLSLTTPLQLSFVWWAKPESGYGGSSSHAAFCTSNNASAPTDYNTTAFHHRDSGFDIYPSDASGVKRLSFTYTLNQWHHYAVTYDGTTARTYQDGVLKTSIEVGANKTLASFSQLYIGFSKAGGVWRKTLGSYSDFRVYVTQLLDTDIKQLYNVGMKIDKSHNIHTYELLQEDKNKLYKTGVLSNSNFNEINNLFNLLYDKQLYIEPDGSCWIRIFHHANCDTKLFASSDTFTTSVYKDADRWFNVSLCNKVNKWELMVKSMPAAGGTETKYRWIQTKNPMTAAYADVAAASVTKVTGNGYASYGWGGLYHIGSSTYLSTNNGTNGNWWGAVGAWANHQGGIPGWTTVITTGYEDVYLRIDNLNQVNLHAKNIKAGMWTANQFIER